MARLAEFKDIQAFQALPDFQERMHAFCPTMEGRSFNSMIPVGKKPCLQISWNNFLIGPDSKAAHQPAAAFKAIKLTTLPKKVVVELNGEQVEIALAHKKSGAPVRLH